MANINKLEIYKELKKDLDDRKEKLAYFSQDYITIEIDKVNSWLHVDWIGYQTEKSVMEGCEKMLEALQQYKLSKVLNDNTNVLGIWTPAAHWVGAVWFPKMKEAGLKKFAWIYSPSRLSRISTDEAINDTPETSIIKTFDRLEEGMQWLLM